MRSKYLILCLPGILLIYMSVFGLAIPSFSYGLAGSLLKEDWTTLNTVYWTPTSGTGTVHEISPAGQLHMLPSTTVSSSAGKSYVQNQGDNPWSDFTIELRLKVDSWGGADGAITLNVFLAGIAFPFRLSSSSVGFAFNPNAGSAGWSDIPTTNDNEWHTWTWTCEFASKDEIRVYRDLNLIHTWSTSTHRVALQKRVALELYDMNIASGTRPELHCDWLYVDSGLHYPDGGGTGGSIKVIGMYSDSRVTCQAYYRTPDGSQSTPITVSNSGSGTVIGTNLEAGVYTVYGTLTSPSLTTSASVTVVDGVESPCTLTFVDSIPGKGSITVTASLNGTVLTSFTTWYVNPAGVKSSSVSVTTGTHTWTNLDPGTYVVHGSYGTATAQKSVTVMAEQNVNVPLTFTAGGFDELTKTIMMVGGFGLCGIGVVGAVLPSARKQSPYAAFMY